MKKDDILESALDEFANYNYNRASINSIIKNSNTSKGTFYYYFDSKEALYLELVKTAMQKKISYLKNTRSEAKELEELSVFEIIKIQMLNSINFGFDNPKFAKFSANIANETNSEIKKKTQNIIGVASGDYLKQLINREISNGRIREDLSKDFIYDLFIFMMTHFNDFLKSAGISININNQDKIMKHIKYYMEFMKRGLSQ